jgi:hypothetical protein
VSEQHSAAFCQSNGVKTSFLVLGLMIATGILLVQETPIGTVEIIVDFGDLHDSYTIKPVWNTINIWDVSFLNGNHAAYDPVNFRQKFYFIDHVNIMTATGGRSTKTNEFYFEDEAGKPYYNFTPILMAVDWVCISDLRATIVIGNVPLGLAAEDKIDYGAFDANTGVPKDYAKYYDYIANLTKAVMIHAGANISRFHWRIMTEPDNADWMKRPSLENYFKIYVPTVRAIRAVIPTAIIELGNMVDANPNGAFLSFMHRIQTEAPDTIPNIVGFSGYGRGQFGDEAREIGNAGRGWQRTLKEALHLSNIAVAIEEGQILSDEDGKRLWSGDGTEFGAAWNAGVFHECILSRIEWYAQWDFYASEVRSPSLNVIDMYEKMEGETLVSTKFTYNLGTKEHQRRLNGLASINKEGDQGHILIYFSDPNHFSTQKYNVKISIQNAPDHWDIPPQHVYLVDKTHSNYFWDYYALFGDIQRQEFGGMTTSVWDLNGAISLHGTPQQSAFYTWSWDNRNNYHLETVDSPQFILEGGIFSTEFEINANSVLMWEFNKNM